MEFWDKLGTPTKDAKGKVRSPSGTVEELYYALEKNPDSVLCMLYVYSKAPRPSFEDERYEDIKANWERVKTFKDKIKDRLIYIPYNSAEELLEFVIKDLAKNVESRFM